MNATWHDQPHPHHHQIEDAIHIDTRSDHFGHTTKIHDMCLEVALSLEVGRKLFGGRLAHLRVPLDLLGCRCSSRRWQRTPSVGVNNIRIESNPKVWEHLHSVGSSGGSSGSGGGGCGSRYHIAHTVMFLCI
jgi:hypothetical protein